MEKYDDDHLIEEKNDYSFSKSFIYDATNCDYSTECLKEILNDVKEKKFYGDIKWPINHTSSELVDDIETQLEANNNEFTRFPSDFIHAQMSKHVYDYDKLNQEKEPRKEVYFNNEPWKVLKIFVKKTGVIGEAKTVNVKANEVVVYVAVLYMNELRKQLVLATKGIEASIFKSHISSHDALSNSLKGILCNETIPQLYQCYKVTRECINIARQNDCFLSFTGFANGAWLAEHSLYYSHQCFKHQKSKAVLFDSPGMVKTEQELEDTGIISKEKKFLLKDMNVVNYLTAPCFANSCNQHVGIVYRLFVNEEKFNKLNNILKLEDRLKEIPALGWLVEKISDKLKNYKFFLIGLATMFNHSNLDLIIDEFIGGPNGRPKYCERVKKWPVLKLKFDSSFGETLSNNIKEWTSGKVEDLVENAPVPGAKLGAKILGKASGWAVDYAASKLLPGDYMLVNILIELSKGTIQMEHFENPNFYLTIGDRKKKRDDEKKKINEIEDEKKKQKELDKQNKASEIPKGSDFSLSFEKHYETDFTDYKKKELNPNINLENNDYCLECLHDLESELKKGQMSKIVHHNLIDLKKQYSLSRSNSNLDSVEKVIDSKIDEIDTIYEKFIRLIILNPDIKKHIFKSMSLSNSYDYMFDIQLAIIENNLAPRNPNFISRQTQLDLIEIFDNNKCVCVHGLIGMGKKELACEFGHRLIENESFDVIYAFEFETFEDDFRHFAKELGLTEETSMANTSVKYLVRDVQYRLKLSKKRRFLFVFLNVLNSQQIEPYMPCVFECKNVKLLVTTPNKTSWPNKDSKYFELNGFEQNEVEKFLNKFYLRKPPLKDEQKRKIFELASIEDNKVLPLKLKLIVNYLNDNNVKTIDKLLNEANSSPNKKHHLSILENFLLKDMSKQVQRLFAYFSYLEPNFIDCDLLNELFPEDDDELQVSLNHLERRGLIKLEERDESVGYSITHRCLQKEMRHFYHGQDRESNEQILKRIAECLAKRVEKPCDRHVRKEERVDFEFKQVKYIVAQLEENKILRDLLTELNEKLGYFYFFYEINYNKALDCFEKVSAVMQEKRYKFSLEKKYQENFATSLYNIGLAYSRLGELDNGIDYAKKAYDMRKTVYEKKPHEKLAQSLSNLGACCSRLSEYKTSLKYYKKCHEMRKSLYGEETNHPEMAHVLNNIGASYFHLEDRENTIKYCERAYTMQKEVFKGTNNGDHADIVETLENLSAAYSSKSSAENEFKSLEYAREAYEMQVRLFPNVNHPRTARLLLSMAQSYSNLATQVNGKLDEYQETAIIKKQEALEMQRMLYNGRDHAEIANTLHSLGKSFEKKRDLDKAISFYTEAYEMRKLLYKTIPHDDLIESLESLQVVYLRKRNNDESKKFEDMAKKMRKEKLNKDNEIVKLIKS